jgi:hypothetical protein
MGPSFAPPTPRDQRRDEARHGRLPRSLTQTMPSRSSGSKGCFLRPGSVLQPTEAKLAPSAACRPSPKGTGVSSAAPCEVLYYGSYAARADSHGERRLQTKTTYFSHAGRLGGVSNNCRLGVMTKATKLMLCGDRRRDCRASGTQERNREGRARPSQVGRPLNGLESGAGRDHPSDAWRSKRHGSRQAL